MERENWFGFACRVAFVAWSLYCAWLLLDWLSLVDKGLDLVRESLAEGRGDRADHFSPNIAISTIGTVVAWRWATVAGGILGARWLFGFNDWSRPWKPSEATVSAAKLFAKVMLIFVGVLFALVVLSMGLSRR